MELESAVNRGKNTQGRKHSSALSRRGQQTFSSMVRRVNIFSFASHIVSVSTIQLSL